jgi:peptidoglycan hydrolase-like protein with peptidoglycan-binding domain
MSFTITCPIARPSLHPGSTGYAVTQLQQAINARLGVLGAPGSLLLFADGDYGPKTTKAVKYIQCVSFLSVDGMVGPITWAYLCNGEISLPVLQEFGTPHAAMTQEIQRILKYDGFYTGALDGVFGSNTKAAVMAYQGASSLFPDGIVGANTWMKLVLRKVSGGSCNV